jgi:uncharacterized protein (DUF2249 family)
MSWETEIMVSVRMAASPSDHVISVPGSFFEIFYGLSLNFIKNHNPQPLQNLLPAEAQIIGINY